jgi:DNA primase
MTPVEEIKSRLDIIDVLGEYLELKPAGANWRARCPFHDERTASFMVSRAKQIWHCFGCGEGGDIFGFVMKRENIDFPEALRLLATKAGVVVKTESPKLQSERERVFQTMDLAATWWSAALATSGVGDGARKYLNARGLTEESIKTWRLGLAPDSWDGLIKALSSKGFNEEDLIKAGLAIKKTAVKGRAAYDRFRNRLMFPIADLHGRIIGTTGRILNSTSPDEAKYVNTPETILYHKGSILYGLHLAKDDIKKLNLAVIVEGNVDVIVSHQVGIKNVVASSGTALTDEQCRLLRRFTDNVAFCFDTDAAGEAATLRGVITALTAGFNVLLIELPVAQSGRRFKDPDECIQADPKLWQTAIANAEPLLDKWLKRAAAERDMSKLEDKQAVVKLFLPVVARLPDKVAEAHYIKKIAELVAMSETQLKEILRANKPQPAPARAATNSSLPPLLRDERLVVGERFLAALIKEPNQLAYAISAILPEMLSPALAALYRAMIVYYTELNQGETAIWSDEAWREHLHELPNGQELLKQLDVLSLLADNDFFEFAPRDIERDLMVTTKRLKAYHLKQALTSLEKNIKAVEQAGDDAGLASLLADYKKISAELLHLDQTKP